MAISTYTELKERILEWSGNRQDADLKVPDFIQLAEADMYNNEEAPLQIKYQEVISTAALSTTSRRIAVPDNYESLRDARLNITDEPGEILYRTPDRMPKWIDSPGKPCYFTVIGTEFEFDRIPDIAYAIEVNQYAKIPALTAAAPTNDILTNYPNIYLFGALYMLFKWVKDTDSANSYKSDFYTAIRGANKSSKIGRFGPSPAMVVEGMVV